MDCACETYGALLLHVQARRVASRELPPLFEAIAVGELSPASLSWDVAEALAEKVTVA